MFYFSLFLILCVYAVCVHDFVWQCMRHDIHVENTGQPRLLVLFYTLLRENLTVFTAVCRRLTALTFRGSILGRAQRLQIHMTLYMGSGNQTEVLILTQQMPYLDNATFFILYVDSK